MKQDKLIKLPTKTSQFITDLTAAGIPLEQIDTNDFSANYKPSIYVTIPYGKERGGKFKKVSNNYLNGRSLKSTIKFYTGK